MFELIRNPAYFLAVGLGAGLIRPASGTWGSVMALLLFAFADYFFHINTTHWVFKILFLILAFVSGIYLCGVTERFLNQKDPSIIVWDEFVGLWLVLAFMPRMELLNSQLADYAIAFILFRLFDILKPPPVRWVDQRVHGGFGIMSDDILAALYALICLYLINYFI